MKAIDFVVRDQAGGVQRGAVSASSTTHVIQASAGQEISLNLRQTDLQGQVRTGNDLVITLTDGRVITIDNYFNTGGAANRLFISSEGYFNEVVIAEAADGQVQAKFGPTEQWGKWNPSDDLIYLGHADVAGAASADEQVSMFPASLLGAGLVGGGLGPAAAVLGGAAVVGTAAGAGEPYQPAEPYVDNAQDVTRIGGDGSGPHTIEVTGGGEPGSAVVLILVGVEIETEINETGTFAARFEGPDFPPDGSYEARVTVTTLQGKVELEGPDFAIDITPPDVAVTAGTESVGEFSNAASLASGVTLGGIGEAGATVAVTLGGSTRTTTVDETGTWHVNWPAGALKGGDYSTPAEVVSIDPFGSTTTIADSVLVDTRVDNLSIGAVGGGADGIANAAEAAAGIDLGGQVEAGSTVLVTFDGTSHAATVDSVGNWSLTIPPGAIRPGIYSAAISVTATDAAGNMETLTDTLAIDTDAPEGPVIASYTRDGDGIRGISTEISPDDLAVHQVSSKGSVSEVTGKQVEIGALGETSFHFDTGVPDGSHLVITATDDAGNLSGTYVVLDDEVATTQVTLDPGALGGYNIETLDLNFAEEGNLTITGETLLALSRNSSELQINGGVDDTVNIAGAVHKGSTLRDGQSYDIYMLGEEGTLIIDNDVTVVI